jgi:prepilin-type N-terminal cleavage/methylation domain-containing protein
MRRRFSARASEGEQGFSMIELLVAMGIFSVIMAVMFSQVDDAQQAAVTERARLDVFQEARAFMDLLARDLHEAGYPSPRNFAPGVLTVNPLLPSSPYAADKRIAVGLTSVGPGHLWFEGDVDGTGQVSVIQYRLDADGNNCPCLRRSQQPKTDVSPLTQTPTYQVEVQNVKNGGADSPIFFAYGHGSTGAAVVLPVDFDNNPATLAGIDTVKIMLTVESNTRDPKSFQKPVTTLVSTVRLNNCSSAASGQFLSCQ